MRDGIGGIFITSMIMVFVIIIVSFLAIAVNYAKTFRIKNRIVDIIEQSQGFTEDVNNDIIDSIRNMGYKVNMTNNELPSGYITTIPTNEGEIYCNTNYGYCVTLQAKSTQNYQANNTSSTSINTVYYQVTTYISFDLPALLGFGSFKIPVRGETISIVTG